MSKSSDKQEKLKKELRYDPKQLALLKKCSDEGDMTAWHDWRSKNLDEVWLQGAKLSRTNLAGANLSRAHLEEANLRDSHMEGVMLFKARLDEANLVFAYLQGARLRFAHLEEAVAGWLVPLRSIYFSIVTMTTLGFGVMYANANNYWIAALFGHLLLVIQVLLGYALLRALVTRFAVLLQSGLIPAESKRNKKKPKRDRRQIRP